MADVYLRKIRLLPLILHIGSFVCGFAQRIEAMKRMKHVNPTINTMGIEELRDLVWTLNGSLSARVIDLLLLPV